MNERCWSPNISTFIYFWLLRKSTENQQFRSSAFCTQWQFLTCARWRPASSSWNKHTEKKTDISIELDTAISASTLLVGRQKGIWPVKNEWWGAGMVICLERGADLHTAQLMPLPLTVSCLKSIKSRLVLPFWYRLTWVVLDKRPLNGCVCNRVRKCHHPGINVLFNNNYSLLSVI